MNVFLTVLEHLVSIVAGLASSANPEFAPVIAIASGGINNELASIASGAKPTLAAAVENVAPGALAIAGGLVAKNNPSDATLLGNTVQAIVSAIPAPPAASNATSATAPTT